MGSNAAMVLLHDLLAGAHSRELRWLGDHRPETLSSPLVATGQIGTYR